MTTRIPESEQRLREASVWLVRLRTEPDSEDAVSSWLHWCESDPANAEAFESVQQFWRQLDSVTPAKALRDASIESLEHVDLALRSVAPMQSLQASESSRLKWRLAASLLIAVGAGATWLWTHQVRPGLPTESANLENRLSSLPDGSSVHLAARTSVMVDFRGGERRLQMSPGEAFFKVKPNKQRPFVVHAGPLAVTAVGTAFDVKEQDGEVSVTVQEGVVAVSPDHAAPTWGTGAVWRVGPGYQFLYTEHDGTASLSSVDTSAVLSWREGRLEYVNAPLTQVLADINRYASHRVGITEAAVGQLTFTGTVFTDSVDSWLQGLSGALPVRLDREPSGAWLIRSRSVQKK